MDSVAAMIYLFGGSLPAMATGALVAVPVPVLVAVPNGMEASEKDASGSEVVCGGCESTVEAAADGTRHFRFGCFLELGNYITLCVGRGNGSRRGLKRIADPICIGGDRRYAACGISHNGRGTRHVVGHVGRLQGNGVG